MAEPASAIELARLRTEIKALRLANAALERQVAVEARQTDSMLRAMEKQANALRESNLRQLNQRDFTQRVMDATAALMIVLRPDGRLRQVNQRFVRELGDPGSEHESRVLDEWVHPEERRRLADGLAALPWPVLSPLFEMARRTGAYAAEHHLLGCDGEYRCYWLEASLQHDPQGKEEGAVVCATDITPLKQQRDRLARSERLLKEAQQIAQMGHWELDLSRNELTWSEEVFRIFELDRASAPRSYADFVALVHPDDRAAVDEAYSSSHAARRAYEIDHRLLFADGRVKWVRERCVTRYDADGRPLRSTGTVQDVTAQRLADEQIHLAASVFDNSLNGIVITDAKGRIVKTNPAFSEILGYSRDELIGKTTSLFKSERHEKSFYEALWTSLEKDGHWQGEIWDRRKDGHTIPLWLSISPVRDKNGRVAQYIGVIYDLSEQKRSAEHIHRLAYYDALTDLPNRQLLINHCERALSWARRNEAKVLLLFLDLDRFKYINDSLGHSVGDELLRAVAKRLTEILRQGDMIARLGGDEFIVLLENVESRQAGEQVARKIMAAFAQPFVVEGHKLDITASIGVSCYPDDGEDAANLIKNADLAMYQAKEEGRGAYRFYAAHLTARAKERLFLEGELREALQREELTVAYQPQVSLLDGSLIGVEALLRWNHKDCGPIPPDKFIPIAEDTGLIVPVGEWLLRTVCRQGKLWLNHGENPGRLAVNLSGVQVERGDIVATVQRVLAETELPPKYLELEITETYVMRQAQRGVRVMEGLRALGVTLAIDDFGTGQSSLSYLKRLPVDRLKIDRSFIMDALHSANEVAIIRAIVALGHSLRLKVLAEGVETAEQAAFLRELKCDEAQGYYYGRPMDAAAFQTLLGSLKSANSKEKEVA